MHLYPLAGSLPRMAVLSWDHCTESYGDCVLMGLQFLKHLNHVNREVKFSITHIQSPFSSASKTGQYCFRVFRAHEMAKICACFLDEHGMYVFSCGNLLESVLVKRQRICPVTDFKK